MSSVILEAVSLQKKYGALTVVDDVSLDIRSGEVVAVTGPSGAGKSTLLHLLGGLDAPDRGQVRIDGTDLFRLPEKKQARFRNERLGFVFQFHHLLPEFTALENVAMPLWIRKAGRREALSEARAMLERVGLTGATHARKPSELSGGEQQRVAIARALIGRPALLLADEPTGNLDTHNAQHIHQLFLDLRDQLGQTIVMITHNDALAARTDRRIRMQDGRIAASGAD